MGRRVATRLLRLIPVLLVITLLTTAAVDLMPGSPAIALLGPGVTQEQVDHINAQLGLDQPLLARYGQWIFSALQGDLGTSVRSDTPVLQEIGQRFPVTLEIALLAVLLALALAVPLGLFAGANPGGRLDRACTFVSSALLSLPAFAVAVLLIFLVALQWRALPVSGWTPFTTDPIGNLRGALLPTVSLALTEAAVYFRLLRSDVTATLGENFVLSARARGLPPGYVLFRHVLRPSMFSLSTVIGLSLGRLLGGAVIVESLFALPGLGTLMLQAVPFQDFPIVQGVVAVVAVLYVVINIAVDVGYSILDPRSQAR